MNNRYPPFNELPPASFRPPEKEKPTARDLFFAIVWHFGLSCAISVIPIGMMIFARNRLSVGYSRPLQVCIYAFALMFLLIIWYVMALSFAQNVWGAAARVTVFLQKSRIAVQVCGILCAVCISISFTDFIFSFSEVPETKPAETTVQSKPERPAVTDPYDPYMRYGVTVPQEILDEWAYDFDEVISGKEVSRYRVFYRGQIYCVWVKRDRSVFSIRTWQEAIAEEKKESKGKKTFNGDPDPDDFYDAEDFYDWYYDDFYDYEEAEEYFDDYD